MKYILIFILFLICITAYFIFKPYKTLVRYVPTTVYVYWNEDTKTLEHSLKPQSVQNKWIYLYKGYDNANDKFYIVPSHIEPFKEDNLWINKDKLVCIGVWDSVFRDYGLMHYLEDYEIEKFHIYMKGTINKLLKGEAE